MSFWDRFGRRPIVAVGVSLVTLLVTAGGLWALLSSEPIVPVALEWARSLGDSALSLLLVTSLAAVVGWMVWIQYRIFRAVSVPKIEDKLPDGVQIVEPGLNAGTDFTVILSGNPSAENAQSLTFSAKQGRKTVVKHKDGVVAADPPRFRLPLNRSETVNLRDGFLALEADVVTGEGNHLVLDRVGVRTRSSLVPIRRSVLGIRERRTRTTS